MFHIQLIKISIFYITIVQLAKRCYSNNKFIMCSHLAVFHHYSDFVLNVLLREK